MKDLVLNDEKFTVLGNFKARKEKIGPKGENSINRSKPRTATDERITVKDIEPVERNYTSWAEGGRGECGNVHENLGNMGKTRWKVEECSG